MTLPLRCAVSWKSLFKGAASGLAAARLMLLAQLPSLCPKVRLYALVQPGPFPAYGFFTSVHPTTAVSHLWAQSTVIVLEILHWA